MNAKPFQSLLLRCIRLLLTGTCLSVLPLAAESVRTSAYEPREIAPKTASHIILPEHIFPELDAIIEQLAKHAPRMRIAHERLSEAEGINYIEKSERLPEVYISGQYNYQTEQREFTGTVDKVRYFWNVYAQQPLYQWGAIEAHSEIGDLRLSQAEIDNEISLSALLQETRRLYLYILAQKASLLIDDKSLQIAQSNYDRMHKEYQLNRIAKIDLTQADIDLQRVEVNRSRKMKNLVFAERQLRQLTGWNGPIIQNLQKAIQNLIDTPFSASEYQSAIGEPTHNRTYQNLQNAIAIEERQYTIAQAKNLPRLNAIAGIFQDQIDSAFLADSEDRTNYFVGALLQWNVFDGFLTSGAKIAANARKRRLQSAAELELQRFQAQSYDLKTDLTLDQQSIEIAAKTLDISQQRLQSATEQLDNGSITENQWLNYLSARDSSQLELINAKITYLNTLGTYLELHSGDPTLRQLDDKLPKPKQDSLMNPWAVYN